MRAMRSGIVLLAVLATGCGDDGSGDDGGGTEGGSASVSGSNGSSSTLSGTEGTSSDSLGTTSTEPEDTTSGTTDPGTSGEASSTGGSGSSDESGGASGGSEGTAGESSSSGGEMIVDDPFDPESCGGTPLTLADLTTALGGMERRVLASATIQARQRTCPGGMCGEWGERFDWVIQYLTWSGGVVTAYKDFQADMQLVVFDDQGTPRLSLQHVTFDVPSSTYDDGDGMIYDVPPSPIGYPHVRAYDDDPDSEYYYQELDWQVRDGVLTLGEDCVRWVADPYVQQPPFTEQYAVTFHW